MASFGGDKRKLTYDGKADGVYPAWLQVTLICQRHDLLLTKN